MSELQKIKNASVNLLYKTGTFAPFHYFNRKKLLILTYHRFTEHESPFSVSRAQFAEHLAHLTKFRTVVPINKIAGHLRNSEKLPENLAIITIDDGYRDAYEIAFPLLKKFSAPATLFAVTDFVDQKMWVWTDKMRYIASKMAEKTSTIEIEGKKIELKNETPEQVYLSGSAANSTLKKLPDEKKDHEIARIARELKVDLPDLPPETNAAITWEQAREMDANDLSIESHTVTHPILPNLDKAHIEYELTESKKTLEAVLQKEIKAFCYPAGGVDEKVWQAVKQADYECAVTTAYGFNQKKENLYLLNRIDAMPDVSQFAQSASGFEDFKIGLKKGLFGNEEVSIVNGKEALPGY